MHYFFAPFYSLQQEYFDLADWMADNTVDVFAGLLSFTALMMRKPYQGK